MKPPIAALAPYLPPPPDLTALSDAALARYLWAMGWRWRDGSSDHTWRLLDEAAERLEMTISEWCPTCGANIVSVTRGIPSMGTCSNGHRTDRRDVLRRPPIDPTATELAALRAALTEAQATIARLEAALEPFAEAADECDEWGHDDENQAPVYAEQCRAARAALSPGKGE